MKYTKINNKIYEVDTSKVLTSLPPQYGLSINGKPAGCAYCADVEKCLAHDIADLCDMFCGTYKDNKDIVRWCLTLDGLDLNELTDCYGLIWTGTGFSRVAKINDKGELELI